MMRKKNALEYMVLAIFIMCMGLALCATLEYVTRATNREYLNQGKWVVCMAILLTGLYFLVRLGHKAGVRLHGRLTTAAWLGLSALFLGAGLLLRLWVIQKIPIEPDSDFETYYRIANHLLNGTLLTPEGALDRRYIALYPHTIGFPMLVLLPVFSLFGASVQNALLANMVLELLSVVVAGHIAYRSMGKLGSVFVTALMSLWPSHILFGSMVATEPSFTFLLLVSADLMGAVMARDERSLYALKPGRIPALLALLGVVLALAGAIRPMAVILLAAFAVVLLTVKGDPSGRIPTEGVRYALSRGWVCLVIVAVLYLGTGAVISRLISDTIVETPAGGLSASGYNLMVGVNTTSQGLWNQEDADFFAQAYEETGSASEAHKACMDVALKRFQDEPENVLDLLVYKFRDLWQTDDFGVDWVLLWTGQQGTLTDELTALLEGIRPIGRAMYMALLLLSLLGALEIWRRVRAPNPLMMICVLFFLGTALSHMLLETQVRYHYNMIPFLILLAGYTLTAWRERQAEEPPMKVVYLQGGAAAEKKDDHTDFDMAAALREGHVRVSVTKRYAEEQESGGQTEAQVRREAEPEQQVQPSAEAKESEGAAATVAKAPVAGVKPVPRKSTEVHSTATTGQAPTSTVKPVTRKTPEVHPPVTTGQAPTSTVKPVPRNTPAVHPPATTGQVPASTVKPVPRNTPVHPPATTGQAPASTVKPVPRNTPVHPPATAVQATASTVKPVPRNTPAVHPPATTGQAPTSTVKPVPRQAPPTTPSSDAVKILRPKPIAEQQKPADLQEAQRAVALDEKPTAQHMGS